MKTKTLIKANKLQDRITKLEKMQIDLRPEFCNGLGIKRVNNNVYIPEYKYDLWATSLYNSKDEDLIMRVGIKAMYEEIEKLLKEAKKELNYL